MLSLQQVRRQLTCTAAVAATLAFAGSSIAQSSGNWLLGLDVSVWQGNNSQTTWNNIRTLENRQFVFVRSSGGGTTGEGQRQGGYPAGNNTLFNLSQRYDDPYFLQNNSRATTVALTGCTPVPEPAAILAIGAGALLLGGRIRWRCCTNERLERLLRARLFSIVE